MNEKVKRLLFVSTLVIVGLYFVFFGLTKAQGFLAPVVTAILLALLMLPLSKKLESHGIGRGWSAFICVMVLMAFVAGIFFVVSLQVQSAAKQWPQMEQKIQPKIEQLQQYINKHTGFTAQSQQQQDSATGQSSRASSSAASTSATSPPAETNNQPSGTAVGSGQKQGQSSQSFSMQSAAKKAGSAVLSFLGLLGTGLLTFIYVFFFLLYRRHFRKSILNMVSVEEKHRTGDILGGISNVAQNYLLGKLILIIFLAVFYSIGLSISGVKQAILISVLAAVLSLLPYVGNIIGLVLALALGMFSGGSSGAVVGILITFGVAQFIESYILEPYVVGEKVQLHPVFTIIAVVLGEHVWGIIGMVIGIPVLAVVKVIADHVPVLHPLGYALGEEQQGKKEKKGFLGKIKEKFTGKRKS